MRIIDGSLTVGMFVAFQGLMASFLAPVEGVVGLASSLQSIRGTLTRLDDVMHYPEDSQVNWGSRLEASPGTPAKLSGEIELRNLVFGYNSLDAPLVTDFSLKVKPGQRVGLVGATGSGKSTVVKLVCGLYEPWEGEVLLDGKPRRDLPRDLIANSVALVDQDITFFEGTIRENLTMWDSTIEEQDIVQAARDACIHDDIIGTLGGYEQRPGEGGRNLSGGQRQRLELARALAINPRILILDEATSSLDPRTEKTIDDNLRRRGCTLLIVAHRLSTIRDCDEIVVMEDGRIVQRGTHDDMIGVEGPYASLLRAG
jgi:ABC-type bacteriocin/lantibiotic exporter with double-glycine peptidase domain